MYNIKSKIAEEFINHNHIVDTIAYAQKNKDNFALIDEILSKAEKGGGIDHKEAAILLASTDNQTFERVSSIAKDIKQRYYGNRIVMFAPLYLSNYCVNGCTYCPYQLKNRTISRKKLSQQEIISEVIALQDMGHKRLALEAGEHPLHSPIEYIIESINTIYGVKNKNGAIRRVNVNIAATSVENYKKLKNANIGTYILFQETYNKERYEALHPSGPKSDYSYHTQAMDRAMEAGIDDVGLGVLFGLASYQYEFIALLMHAEHLEATFGVGPHTVSVPRICSGEGVDTDKFQDGVDDDTFKKIVALMRIALPYAGMIISTRESQKARAELLGLGITQISGGSKTSVGGYSTTQEDNLNTSQFEISDNRTLDEIVMWLLEEGHIPSFCTACYRRERTGDRFMSLLRSGNIANCCAPNALMTLEEYLIDYASPTVKSRGSEVVVKELEKIENLKIKDITKRNLDAIKKGERDLGF